MSIICPTVTPSSADPHVYREQLERVAPLCDRIQIDLMDGDFAPNRNTNLIQLWWPDHISPDIHLMYRHPLEHIETLISLQPSMVIIHAEAEGDLLGMITHLRKFTIKTGVALLQPTAPDTVADLIRATDHVLIFSGDLGSFGGHVDMTMLQKVASIKAINPDVEIGWDGGANETNVAQLAEGGIDVINVGGAIQRSQSPQDAYDTLVAKISTT